MLAARRRRRRKSGFAGQKNPAPNRFGAPRPKHARMAMAGLLAHGSNTFRPLPKCAVPCGPAHPSGFQRNATHLQLRGQLWLRAGPARGKASHIPFCTPASGGPSLARVLECDGAGVNGVRAGAQTGFAVLLVQRFGVRSSRRTELMRWARRALRAAARIASVKALLKVPIGLTSSIHGDAWKLASKFM